MIRKEKYNRELVLAILFALWLPLYTGYLAYDGLVEVDLLSPTLIFENPDQDSLLADQQSKWKPFPVSADSTGIAEGSPFPEPVLLFSMPTSSPSPLSISLRC